LPNSYAICTSAGGYQPHGPYMYSGTCPQNAGRYFWIDVLAAYGSSTVTFTLSVAETSGGGVYADMWDDGFILQNVVGATYAADASSVALTIPNPGYYCFRFVAISAVTISSMIYSNPGTPTFCHLPIPGYEMNWPAVNKVRIPCVSLKLTNKAAVLYQQGEISILQWPTGVSWTKHVAGSTVFNNFASAANQVTYAAKNGIYGYLKPTSDQDLNFHSPMRYNGLSIQDVSYPLAEQSDYIGAAIEVEEDTGREFIVTKQFGVEYESTDVWREYAEGTVANATWDEALTILKKAPQFGENPFHWKTIWGGIKKIAANTTSAIKKYGPTVMGAAATLGSML